jgi:hypothetical protein
MAYEFRNNYRSLVLCQRPELGEEHTIKRLKDKRTKGQTMVYNTLPRKQRIDN